MLPTDTTETRILPHLGCVKPVQVHAGPGRRNGELERRSMETSHTLIEIGARAIEAMAVAVIVGTFLWVRTLSPPYGPARR